MPEVRWISVVGRQNAGKTLLASHMVAYWQEKGNLVAAIKHDGHAYDKLDWEKVDSDTERLGQAGAKLTLVTGGGQSLMRVRDDRFTEEPRALARRVMEAALETVGRPCDIIVVEGFKTSDVPKIAVLRDTSDLAWLEEQSLPSLIAVVGPASVQDIVTDRCLFYEQAQVPQMCEDLWRDARVRWVDS